MSKNEVQNFRIPNVTKLPGQEKVDVSNKLTGQVGENEFKKILENTSPLPPQGIELSGHAAKRLQERKIDFNGDEYLKVRDAMLRLKEKGGKDSLIVTNKAAYIVDVENNKVVTAVDKESMNENVFTKIDSTVILN